MVVSVVSRSEEALVGGFVSGGDLENRYSRGMASFWFGRAEDKKAGGGCPVEQPSG